MASRRGERLPGWRRWVAYGASYLLALHLLVAGFASVAHAGAAHLDGFGNLICSAAANGSGDPTSPDTGQKHVPPCCILGCSLVAHAALLACSAVLPAVSASMPCAAPFPASRERIEAFQTPQQARAPPHLI